MFLFRHNWPAKIGKIFESRLFRPKKSVFDRRNNGGGGPARREKRGQTIDIRYQKRRKTFAAERTGRPRRMSRPPSEILPLVLDHRAIAGAGRGRIFVRIGMRRAGGAQQRQQYADQQVFCLHHVNFFGSRFRSMKTKDADKSPIFSIEVLDYLAVK